MSDPRSRHYAQMRHENLPPDHLFGRRTETLTLAVMSQLRATGNWHRIAREWIFGDPPVTELGLAEAAFYGAQRRWIWSRLVVPGTPLGSPAVIPTR